MTDIDRSPGTALWAINRFRTDILGSLLDDLSDLESRGLEDHECRQVKATLAKMTNAATGVPDHSFWRRSIWRDFERFEAIYEEWNSPFGGHPDVASARKGALRLLRKRRHLIASRIRRNQYILQNELDLQLIKDLYEAAGSLCNSVPDLFKNLSRAVRDVQKVISTLA
jgi:hypothetical protein